MDDYLAAEDAFRSELAQRLHDGLGQDVSAMLLICEALSTEAPSDEMRDMMVSGRRCLHEARLLSLLVAPKFQDKSLAEALTELLRVLEGNSSVAGSVECQEPISLDEEAIRHLYLCLAEAVDICSRLDLPYAVKIWMGIDAGRYVILLSDNAAERSAGGAAMSRRACVWRERVRRSGGSLELPPEGDARLRIILPLEKSQGLP